MFYKGEKIAQIWADNAGHKCYLTPSGSLHWDLPHWDIEDYWNHNYKSNYKSLRVAVDQMLRENNTLLFSYSWEEFYKRYDNAKRSS